MNSKEARASRTAEQKQKIRERYKGIDSDKLDVIPALPQDDIFDDKTVQRVAVYARVSTDDPRQTSSYELQKNHYTDMVEKHANWQLVDIYADEGISGTSLQHRDSFIRMIKDCNAGKIDLIVTKSVSRFARNILDCIGYVRKLKAMKPPIGVFFETENIHTLSASSEMSLSFISTLAQEESHTKSEIMNASIEMRFKRGLFLTPPLLGYDRDEDGNLVINEDEAKIVRLIFFMYLYGYSCQIIAETLTRLGCETKKGNTTWSAGGILQILQNERHCGDVLARKTYTPNFLDHKSKKNRQNRNQYRQADHHESIVSRDDFIAVQHLIHNAKYGNKGILPSLNVVKEGMLTGFVSINPRWAGFKPDEYVEACLTAYDIPEEADEDEIEIRAEEGDFDLRGFEIARGQFFDSSGRACVTISHDTIKFNTETVRKFGDVPMVEMLIHPDKMLFAVRPATEKDANAVTWSRKLNGKTVPRPVSGRACLPAIFRLLGWKKKCKYKMLGVVRSKGDEKVMVFDLQDIEIQMPDSFIAASEDEPSMTPFKARSRNQILAYPADWGEGFGKAYYSHAQAKELEEDALAKWDVTAQGQPYKESDLQVTDRETLHAEINSIIGEMEEDTNERV